MRRTKTPGGQGEAGETGRKFTSIKRSFHCVATSDSKLKVMIKGVGALLPEDSSADGKQPSDAPAVSKDVPCELTLKDKHPEACAALPRGSL
ncbi:putative 60S ribosomal protein L27a-1 [Dissostichus eleginoides]|uniref:60S ribosomal protein L27a-1 n=1 Tax=Dissostichus eleginoides TaxID=100907 RepID=A0AAD9BBG0_DISEL|nr:putative 60S ribosomal protein L27a-1 [Dissostichus eleginoides]